jgi:hypothetical protein
MKQFYFLITFLFVIFLSSNSNAQISGIVFRDYNANGVKDNSATFNETFVSGIVVKVYNATNVLIATLTTSGTSAPNYSFPASGPNSVPAGNYRVEFTGLSAVDYSSNAGNDNGTSVQFVTAPNANVDYAINAPEEFWDNTANPNPLLMAVHEKKGTSNNTVTGGTYTLLQLYNNSSGPNAPLSSSAIVIDTVTKRAAIHSQTGALFGLAYQNKQKRFFASAMLKRICGLGPLGAGGIYIADSSTTLSKYNYSGAFTLQGVIPSNSAVVLDFGTVTRVTTPTTNDNYINSTNDNSTSRDIDAFDKVGKMAYGDIEAQPGTDSIILVNLFQKRLIKMDVSGATTTLNTASLSTLGSLIKVYDITSLPGCPLPTGAGNQIRPYGLKIYRGKGYLGVVSDAQATQNINHLIGYVLQFDPNNIAAGFTIALTVNFNLYEGSFPAIPTLRKNFLPWVSTYAQAGGDGTTNNQPLVYGQPIISAIEFNEDGSMDIGIRDRYGDQGGDFELNPVSGATATTQTQQRGDLLHAFWYGNAWHLEGMDGVNTPQNTANGDPTLGFEGSWGESYTNTGKEYYADRGGDGATETSNGGTAKLMGTGIMVSSVYDPVAAGANIAAPLTSHYYSTQGIQWNNVATGVKAQIARTMAGGETNIIIGNMGKANGMGDIEFALAPQPIQIGNRIWNDLNANGIQDANETTSPVAAGTTVSLYTSTNVLVATTTTNASGNYYFSTLNVAADPRKPATWTGIGNTILPGYDYRIEIGTPSGFYVTLANIGGNAVDHIDNDATSSGANAIVIVNANNVNHNFDIGFAPNSTLPVIVTGFTATPNNNTVDLKWQVQNQQGIKKYEAEHSTNGRTFTKIDEVPANNHSVSSYSVIHNNPVNGNNYYRIKIIEQDGTFSYTSKEKINWATAANVMVYPNPVKDVLIVTVPNSLINKTAVIKLITAGGKIVLNRQVEKLNAIETINLGAVPSGKYILQLTAYAKVITKKVEVIR